MTEVQFQTKILRRTTTPDDIRIYRAGLEWDLTDPIVIQKRDDLRSELRWRDRVEPYNHQITNLITFCRRLPVTLIADDVGLGKTISAGLIVSELISRSRVSNILVVCPKLLGPQWKEELETKFNIPSEIAIGQELIAAEPEPPSAVITTYASARLHLDKLPDDRFQMLILDEAHKLRNLYGVDNPPQVAIKFRDALEQRRFRFVLMLTATPIQNRLWDLYSLVDLLTVARGHENPFGSQGMFARKFIADRRDQARRLKVASRDEFRSIVYGYMSRIRRGDAKLYFPDRVVQTHRVNPSSSELELIATIAKPIQKLNRLAQISILQALTSSPDALMAQLNNMARNGTVPGTLAAAVRDIVTRMPPSAKLRGLGALIDKLTDENPDRWRLLVFTGRIETQTTIQAFLEARGLKVGLINGSSGPRNQDTLKRFRSNPPQYHVIVSTEAGSEGVNLQVANVLVNFDLPWNPMIVEQRIGRIQRLASEHANVIIFNVILKDTFEEYIVGRLMEKLQMASHAIGDIEALLEASGLADDDGGPSSFDEQIRKLVLATLAGKNVEEAMRQAEESIANAKATLEREEANINALLGDMDGSEYVGPRAPNLPPVSRTMESKEFTLAALENLGAHVTPYADGLYLSEEDDGREYIRFGDDVSVQRKSTLYAPGTAAFSRLVGRTIASGVFKIEDLDKEPLTALQLLAGKYVATFGAVLSEIETEVVERKFEGAALLRVRATVAHDSYERLVEVHCLPGEHHRAAKGQVGLVPLDHVLENPGSVGIVPERLTAKAEADVAIAEFCRFYLERREEEALAAGGDERKRKKLSDEFTPRLLMTLVGLEGKVHRDLKVTVTYEFDDEARYKSAFTVVPHTGEIKDTPKLARCAVSGKTVPQSCLGKCVVSGEIVLQHLLAKSELSARTARPEHALTCTLSGKVILEDEAETSDITGRAVASALLKTSAVSGKRAEPQYFDRCAFTNAELLREELVISEVSGKPHRQDEQLISTVSGKRGHKQEFVECYETRQSILIAEAEECEITGHKVRSGILEECSVTHKRVLPTELERCATTGRKALKTLLVTSSMSGVRVLEDVAFRSAAGEFCAPIEGKACIWSSKICHPQDLRVCELTGLSIHFQYSTDGREPRLSPLVELLDGVRRSVDGSKYWETISLVISSALRSSHCRLETATHSPDNKHLAVCCELRTLLGLRVQYVGFVFSVDDENIIGRIVRGKRTPRGWEWSERKA